MSGKPLVYAKSPSPAYRVARHQLATGRLIFGTLVALTLLTAGAVGYTKVVERLDEETSRLFAFAVAAGGIGLLAALPVRVGRVRRMWMARALGAALASWAVYAMWVEYAHGFIERAGGTVTYVRITLKPFTLASFVWELKDEVQMWWRLHRIPSGVLALLWGLEAAVFVAVGCLAAGLAVVRTRPLCTACGTECRQSPPLPKFATAHRAEVVSAMERGDFAALTRLDPPPDEEGPAVTLRLYCCGTCGETNVADVSIDRRYRTDANMPKVVSEPIVSGLLFEREQVVELAKAIDEIETARDAARVASEPEA